MIDDNLRSKLEKDGYQELTYVKGKGICGLYPFAFTIGLCCGIGEWGYDHRYCYPHKHVMTAILQLRQWGGLEEEVVEDPQDEFWIKRKGSYEHGNLNHKDFDIRFDKPN
tara:strand:+ start:210 stop:539 length:330 start_codon:yes stop_codon:yes gene_type:complete